MPYCYEFPRPMLTCDVVLFRRRDAAVEVLLVRRKHDPFAGRWAIPGGFVGEEEKVEDAARRELTEETALRAGALRQFGVFGDPGRDPRGRMITLAYYGLCAPGRDSAPRAGDDAAEARWFRLSRLPREIAFDHRKILRAARARLREDLRHWPRAFRLLGRRFTLDALADVLDALHGRKLDRRAFRRRVVGLGVLRPVPGGYRLDARRFRELTCRGITLPDS
jgi:8-oxo-dGTP diphosphatase